MSGSRLDAARQADGHVPSVAGPSLHFPTLAIVEAECGFRNFLVDGPTELAVALVAGLSHVRFRSCTESFNGLVPLHCYQTSFHLVASSLPAYLQWADSQLRDHPEREPCRVVDLQCLIPYIRRSHRASQMFQSICASLGLDAQIDRSLHPADGGPPIDDWYDVPGTAEWLRRFGESCAPATSAPSVPAEPPAEVGLPCVAEEPCVIAFDVEMTGLASTDQIIAMAVLRYTHGILDLQREYRFNPTVPISPSALSVHGITALDLADEPRFEALADEVRDIFDPATCFLGYNIRFDVDVLNRELRRVGSVPLDLSAHFIDPYAIWVSVERRRLNDACMRFLRVEHGNAHDALGDIVATMHLLPAMLESFSLEENDAAELTERIRGSHFHPIVKHFVEDQGHVKFAFGKYKGESVLVDEGYLKWMLRGDFPAITKTIAQLAIAHLKRSNDDVADAFETEEDLLAEIRRARLRRD